VLQEKQFERVGGSETITVNVRVIAATNIDLNRAIKEKRFREDLYYRLNVITLHLPPIRERGDDIDIFAHHFLHIYADETGKNARKFSDDAMESLRGHHWPGNIRELENAIERSVILTNGEIIRPEHLMLSRVDSGMSREHLAHSASPHNAAPADSIPVTAALWEVEKIHIERVLQANHWNQSAAAQVLGVDRKTLRSKVREFHLAKDGE
jgi:DNA-binding NtrC family response regulator